MKLLKGQFRMSAGEELNGWVIAGPKGLLPLTFRMTYEAAEALWAKRKAQGYEATLYQATMQLRGKVKS